MRVRYEASDSFMTWAQSLSGFLTTMRCKYGNVVEMVEHVDWDESKTERALSLLRAIHTDLSATETELRNHVEEKFGKD